MPTYYDDPLRTITYSPIDWSVNTINAINANTTAVDSNYQWRALIDENEIAAFLFSPRGRAILSDIIEEIIEKKISIDVDADKMAEVLTGEQR